MPEDVTKNIHHNILKKAINGLRQEGWNYTGLFGAKIMMTTRGPVVLGFRCTFQGLDEQVVSPLLKSDLYDVIQTANEGRLSSYIPTWSQRASQCHPSSKERDIQAKHGEPEGPLTMTKIGKCEPNKEAVTSSSEEASRSLEAFPGAMYSKDGSSDCVHHTEWSSSQVPHETHLAVDYISHAEEKGSKALLSIHQTSGKTVCSFEVNTAKYKDPVFLCTTNSIDNIMKVVQACSLHRLAAQRLVTICVNNLLSQGARAVFFMPCLALGKLNSEAAEAVLEGLAEACKTTGSTLLERGIVQRSMSHHDGCFSLSGCAVGVVEREYQLPRLEQMREGDMVIGVRSPGLHCSSLDLLKEILNKHSLQLNSTVPMNNGEATWGEMLMSSASGYSPSLLQTLQSGHIRACIPLTDGGLVGSILQYLPKSIGLVIDALCWKIPPVYCWLYKEGGLSEPELVNYFSCGLGTIIIVQRTMAQRILTDLQQEEEAWLVGGLIRNSSDSSRVCVSHLLEALKLNAFQLLKPVFYKKRPAEISRAAVLISGTGMKLKTLIDTFRQLDGSAKLSLVISSKSAVEELRKAVAAGIPTRVVDHTLFTCHSDFENTISKVLDEFSVDVICLAGFSRTLSERFLTKWKGKIVKLHTWRSLSQKEEPAGKMEGLYGCSVSFLLGGSSVPGPMIIQETVRAASDVSIIEHMEEAEPRAVAKALHLLSSGIIHLGPDGHTSWGTEH